MSQYVEVPVTAAKAIAERYQKSQVVILAWDPVHKLTHTTTYGVEAFDKENAAAAGEICTAAIGADLSKRQTFEDFHRDLEPALYREAVELFKVIRARNGCTAPQLQQIDRWLKTAGYSLRQG